MCAHAVCPFDDGFGVIDIGAAKDDVGDRNEQRLFVNGGQQAFCRDMDSIVCSHHVHTCAEGLLSFPEVHDRGKIHVGVDDLVALAGKIKARCHHRLALRHILVNRNRVALGVHQPFDHAADLMCQHPPGFFPGAHSARHPHFGIFVQRLLRCARHRSQGVADQVGSIRQDGKLRAKPEKLVGHGRIVLPPHRSGGLQPLVTSPDHPMARFAWDLSVSPTNSRPCLCVGTPYNQGSSQACPRAARDLQWRTSPNVSKRPRNSSKRARWTLPLRNIFRYWTSIPAMTTSVIRLRTCSCKSIVARKPPPCSANYLTVRLPWATTTGRRLPTRSSRALGRPSLGKCFAMPRRPSAEAAAARRWTPMTAR